MLLHISPENVDLLCFIQIVVHTYNYIHLVRLPMTHVSTTRYKQFHVFLDTQQKVIPYVKVSHRLFLV